MTTAGYEQLVELRAPAGNPRAAGLADERGRQQTLERDLAALKEHVTILQARIEEIEERLGRRGG